MSAPLVITPAPSGYVRVRFVTDATDLLSAAIRLDTMGGFSHCEAVLSSGTVIGAYGEGVEERPNNFDTSSTAQQFVDIPMSDDLIAWDESWLVNMIGTPYDYAAIKGFALHCDMHDQGHVICSALQTERLRRLGLFDHPLAQPFHMISPRDLHLMLSALPSSHGVRFSEKEER